MILKTEARERPNPDDNGSAGAGREGKSLIGAATRCGSCTQPPVTQLRARWAAGAFGFVALMPGLLFAQAAGASDRTPPSMVEWLEPALPTNQPQTPAEEEAGKARGRSLPRPEILQPTLDPALPVFHPCKNGTLRGNFKGASSDVLPGLVRLWIERFNRYCPKVQIGISPPFAGSLGAQELVKQSLDFVFVSRELKPDDIEDFRRKFGYAPLSVPVSGGSYRHFGFLDAVGFFVNKDNPLERITFQQLDAILSSTRHRGGAPITAWGQLGLTGEWADKPIHVYAVKPWNGFEEFVRQRVLSTSDQRGEWRTDLNFERLIFPIAGHVAQDRYALGYSGLAFVDAGVKSLAVAQNESGPFYSPSYENVVLATYSLTRLIYFNINRAPGKPLDPALAAFLHFILSKEGQQAVLDEAIYLPLRAGQAAQARAMID
jgi:phosphate transport system substrate-binding protein